MSQPVRVAHVVLALDVGGLEKVVLRLIQRLDRARFESVVCALEHPGSLAPELERLGVRMTVLGKRAGLDPLLPGRLARWLATERVALVHTHNPSPHLYGAVAARLAGALGPRPGVVHTKHGRNYTTEPRKVLLNRLASRLTDRVVAVSDDARAVAIDIERVPPTKVVTILNGVDTTQYQPAPAGPARRLLGIPESGFHVGCVARLSPEKDHASLIEAFRRFRGQRPDAHLTIVGDGPLRAELERKAEGLGTSVTFTGVRSDVAEVISAFDVFALASLTEGISLTLIEAAAAGLPIVATRVGGNGEIVIDGDTGRLAPAADPAAFAAALADIAARSDRPALGMRGRQRVLERFSLDGMGAAYEALYDDVLGAVRGGGPRRHPVAPAGDPRRGGAPGSSARAM